MKAPLGFGTMRLPFSDGDQTKIEIDKVSKMFDLFLERGFTYFDTSYVYHGGASEIAVRKALVERHPRDSFTIATKHPIFKLKSEDQVEKFFNEQLEKLGVDYFDYYLLHNLSQSRYEQLVEKFHVFDFVKKMKEQGKIKHIGFSLHDSSDVLDRILTEHPEVEFVQIVINYFDWDSVAIQSRKNYETIRKHGKKVVIMETVKGGMLSTVPKSVEDQMKKLRPNDSVTSWAVRFAASLDGVLAVLSGMSSLEQVDDNTKTMADFAPVTDDEKKFLAQATDIIRESGPMHKKNFDWVQDRAVAEVLDSYNAVMIQPIPAFSAEHSYYPELLLKKGLKRDESVLPSKVLDESGKDITEQAKTAEETLRKMGFYYL